MSRRSQRTRAARPLSEAPARSRGTFFTLALYAVPLALAAIGALGERRAGKKLAVVGEAEAAPGAEAGEPGPRRKLVSSVFGDARFRGRIELGKRVREGDRFVAPVAGGAERVVLTLDPVLQARAEALLAEAGAPYGAIVIMTPDGRVLAMAGASTAEPARAAALPVSLWAPSASIFKLVTAAALLDAGLTPDSRACFHGGIRSVDAANLKDHPDDTCADLTFGVAHSQNALMAKLAHQHLDGQRLAAAASALGFNGAPDGALEVATSTFTLPADPLERARAAAGFWHSELTPLGGALLAATIANQGLRVTPRIVAAVLPPDGAEELPVPAVAPVRALDPDTAAGVGEMMVETTEQGTAFKAFHDKRGRRLLGDVKVAGKTGSLSRTEPTYINYSWFVGYAPADNPQYVVSVLLGNSATWRFKSHTVARLLLQTALP